MCMYIVIKFIVHKYSYVTTTTIRTGVRSLYAHELSQAL